MLRVNRSILASCVRFKRYDITLRTKNERLSTIFAMKRQLSLMSKIGLSVGGIFAVANIGFIASAIPAVLGKGAPYVPTLRRSLDIIFDDALPTLLKRESKESTKTMRSSNKKQSVPLIIDLGSGDGRVVIEAARNGYPAVGYELNPGLVAISQIWATYDRYMPTTRAWPETASATFYTRDLWSVGLQGADVIFVYGLTPIMEKLSQKIIEEAPNAIVVSNVFEMDPKQWKKVFHKNEVYVYKSIVSQISSNKSIIK